MPKTFSTPASECTRVTKMNKTDRNNVNCERMGTSIQPGLEQKKNHYYKCVHCNCVSSSSSSSSSPTGCMCRDTKIVSERQAANEKAISAIPLHARRTFNDSIFQTHIILKEQMLNFNARPQTRYYSAAAECRSTTLAAGPRDTQSE